MLEKKMVARKSRISDLSKKVFTNTKWRTVIGDLKGVISKLDYLKDLGIDIIWLSPNLLFSTGRSGI